jgi:VanZ family protein
MFFKYCWKALLWALFILVVSALPGKAIPEVRFIGADKIVHAMLYAILSILLITGLLKQNSIPVMRCFACSWSLLLCSIYGGLLEIMQHYFIPDRTGDIKDVYFNSGSALLVSIICAVKFRSL